MMGEESNMADRPGPAKDSSRSAIFTLDLEDHTHAYAADGRYRAVADRILSFLAEREITGTVFVVGRIAETNPDLVRAFADQGHELACHSYRHTPLDRERPDTFRDETHRAKELIEQCTGRPVKGYRAPSFSLTSATLWTLEILQDLGFTYSSSVMPASNPLYGFPQAPKHPFRWPNGLVELPVPLATFGPVHVPFLGGTYLRLVPRGALGWLLSRVGPATVPWIYVHPHDFDSGEPFARIPGASIWTSALLWLHRRGTFAKVAHVIERTESRTFIDLILTRGFADGLPVFDVPNGGHGLAA